MKQMDFQKERDEKGRESVVIGSQSKRRVDLIPRLLCLLFAIFIWIYCVNINESDVTATFSVKLNVVGAESMSNGMSVYSSLNVSEVKITVQGTNRDINKYSASDYSAYIDVSQIDSVGWSTIKIVTTAPESSSLTILSTDIDAISVYADVAAETTVPLEIKEGSITHPLNYKISYNLEDGVNEITIKGPKTMIDEISRAEYLLEGEFNKSKVVSGFSLNFYNKNGELISANNGGELSPSSISYDTSKMKINVSVTAPVVLKIKATGSTPNYIYTVDPVTANVIGDPEMLNALSDYIIDMGDKGVGEYKVTITAEKLAYPEGVKLEADEITVTVRITEGAPVTPPMT